MENLTAEGVNVQLKHDEAETSWEEHGWISLVREADGTELYREEDYQHNSKYRDMKATAGKVVETVMAALEEEPKAAGADAADAATAPAPAALARADSHEAA